MAHSFKQYDHAKKTILVTGGAGYIGTHTILSLLEDGYDVTVVDNLCNSSEEGLRRVKELANCDSTRLDFHKVDLLNVDALENVFTHSPRFRACIHFAGLKAVGESVDNPLLYYENNLMGTINLLHAMAKHGCHSIVFSSSATVYGAAPNPINENAPAGVGITNAYGRTKFMIEEILKDFKRAKDQPHGITSYPWSVVILRYFNPIGAHSSGRIGEDPNGIPNNLMPYVNQVVVGRREKLTIFGSDYETKDGTGVRDYIHVVDLAAGHLAALKYIQAPHERVATDAKEDEEEDAPSGHAEYSVFNLGTGVGYSVLEMVAAMEKASGKPVPYEIGERRLGDIAECYSDASLAKAQLGWSATRSLEEMCADSWRWTSGNPNGFESK
eukprot:CAMPEP_0181327594 /NCGR_PEP_ID=MMETSP1101-20121128/22197_1 /TAXON_ID=46948 /ORGANISM="Rhodomonas abbreviata, Strain Caron Lab Isolate" /LENGTH=383 /DNA_ID=CAMNT_0023436289 /DNA_START=49 /DNA_END=1200 /DNA_ORIENTATION=-